MRTIKRHTRPQKAVFCLLLVTVLLCLTVFAAVPENGVNTPMFGAGETHSHDSARNRSGDNGAANAAEDVVTDAADAIGGAVSDAGNAVGEVIGDIGEAAGEVVSDAGNAIGDAADAIGGADRNTSGKQSNADENKLMPRCRLTRMRSMHRAMQRHPGPSQTKMRPQVPAGSGF